MFGLNYLYLESTKSFLFVVCLEIFDLSLLAYSTYGRNYFINSLICVVSKTNQKQPYAQKVWVRE